MRATSETQRFASTLAVWRWPRSMWGVVLVLTLFAYPFTAVPANYFIAKAGLWNTPVQTCFEMVYAPVIWSFNRSPFCRDFGQWQAEWMVAMFGEL